MGDVKEMDQSLDHLKDVINETKEIVTDEQLALGEAVQNYAEGVKQLAVAVKAESEIKGDDIRNGATSAYDPVKDGITHL